MMIFTQPMSLITLGTILMISLFFPQLPQSAEQWLSLLLQGTLIASGLMVVAGCRRFILG